MPKFMDRRTDTLFPEMFQEYVATESRMRGGGQA